MVPYDRHGMSTVRIERQDELAILRLDKARGGAIDEPMIEDLAEACRTLEEDGSVRGFSNSITRDVWRALGTRAGGEVVSSDQY